MGGQCHHGFGEEYEEALGRPVSPVGGPECLARNSHGPAPLFSLVRLEAPSSSQTAPPLGVGGLCFLSAPLLHCASLGSHSGEWRDLTPSTDDPQLEVQWGGATGAPGLKGFSGPHGACGAEMPSVRAWQPRGWSSWNPGKSPGTVAPGLPLLCWEAASLPGI